MEYKIKSQIEIAAIASEARSKGKTIVTTNGSFDILHYAHADLLSKAKQEGDLLIVLLNSDASIKKNKGPKRPIVPEAQRALMLAALEAVDYVVIFEEEDPLKVLRMIQPQVHVKGGSFIAERIQQEQALLAEWQGRFKNFELQPGVSSSLIIDKVLENYREET